MEFTFQNIVDIAKQGESSTLEFKKSTTQLKSAAESLCAFLNTYGGLVLIGVPQNGEIVGQHITDATQQEIANLMQKFEPHANVNISYITVPNTDRKVIVMQALPHPNEKPYIFDGRPYYREQSATIQMTQSRYQQQLIHRQNNPLAWDKQIVADYAIDELDHERIINVFQQAIKRKRIPWRLLNSFCMIFITSARLTYTPQGFIVVVFFVDTKIQCKHLLVQVFL
ncbi:MAG: helix-turn-helix domain-containing protein [Gammaproteobacteria bacterium]